jgi:phytoene dehydrogenase-like protein
VASFGLAREYPGEPWLTMLVDPDGHQMAVRLFNYSRAFAPPGHTVVQVSREVEWESWAAAAQNDRPAYEAMKRDAADLALAAVERLWPGSKAAVEVQDVATPWTTYRYTLNRRGAYEGFLPTPEVVTKTVPRQLPGLERFWMAGQWVMPGGGVPPVLYSGRHAAQLICRADRRRFRAP